MTKKFKDTLKYLGSNYSVKNIDLENVIYRDLGNGFDFEISGLDNSKHSFNASVYVWNTKNGSKVVETIHNINSKESLNETLNTLNQKYQNIPD